MLMLALGLGLVAGALMVSYRDVQQVLPILVQMLLYISPVAYSLEAIPENLQLRVLAQPARGRARRVPLVARLGGAETRGRVRTRRSWPSSRWSSGRWCSDGWSAGSPMSSSSDTAIAARGLGKSYPIASNLQPTTLGEALATRARHPFHRATKETFWALHDVDFEARRGEVVGIIGRNGAGKSTLLKILSRITEPSAGEVQIVGRVGSLLEVGTGFHPELTGRENVYLNGAILGMERSEVARHFDSIVDFSGVSRFLDMPVKRYSSGMSVRLAFAVAAHLEPEILLVDEVLAVGDAEFQRRCLGKMSEVASNDARTVLFVSHNMGAIETLCDRCIVLEGGTVDFDGPPVEAVTRYIALLAPRAAGIAGEFDLTNREDRTRWANPILQRVRFVEEPLRSTGTLPMGGYVSMIVDVEGLNTIDSAYVGIELYTDLDQRIATFHARMKPPLAAHARATREEMAFRIGPLPLLPGRYWLSIGVWDPNRSELADRVNRAASLDVTPANVYGSGYAVRPGDGSVFMDFDWELRPALSAHTVAADASVLDAQAGIAKST